MKITLTLDDDVISAAFSFLPDYERAELQFNPRYRTRLIRRLVCVAAAEAIRRRHFPMCAPLTDSQETKLNAALNGIAARDLVIIPIDFGGSA